MKLRSIAVIPMLARWLVIQQAITTTTFPSAVVASSTIGNNNNNQRQQRRGPKRLGVGERGGGGSVGETKKKKKIKTGEEDTMATVVQGPSDCCEPPKNLPPDVVALLLNNGGGGEGGGRVGVDISKDAIESGKDFKSDPAPLDSLVITVDAAATVLANAAVMEGDAAAAAAAASASILESLGINITDTSMEGGGFNPVMQTIEGGGGAADAFGITNSPAAGEVSAVPGMMDTMLEKPIDWGMFPRTGIEDSELVEFPVDKQLLAFEAEGTLTMEEVEKEELDKDYSNKDEDVQTNKARGSIFSNKTRGNIFSNKQESDARKLHQRGIDDDSQHHHRRRSRQHHQGSSSSIEHDHNRRNLQAQGINTAPIGLFKPLVCNANITTANCSANKLSTLLSGGSTTAAVTVPCGQCYTYDLSTSTPTTIGGLDIRGKLYVPPNYKSTLLTRYVFVQGVLEMSDTNPISKNNTSMKIILTGNTDVTFVPADSNANVVGGTFNAGVKPFLIAGGQLNVRGWTGSLKEGGGPIETWTTMMEMVVAAPPNVTLSRVPGKESTALVPPLALVPNTGGERLQCPRKLVDHNFDTSVDYRVWSGGEGKIIQQVNGTIVLKNISTSWQGFKLDFRSVTIAYSLPGLLSDE